MSTHLAAEGGIRDLIAAFRRAMNDGNARLAAVCFTADGVLMAPNGPIVVGRRSIEGLYTRIFSRVVLQPRSVVTDVEMISDIVALVCSTSRVARIDHVTGAVCNEDSREIMIVERDDDVWRIGQLKLARVR